MARNNKELCIAIVGAGIGGLSTALALAKQGFTQISIYETASNLGFVGAGIQLAPNMARILERLGCWADIYKEAVELKETSIRQGDLDSELGHVDLQHVRENYEYPHMVGHRASLVGALFEACKRESSSINLIFSTTVMDVLTFTPRPSFTVRSRAGEEQTLTADVLLGADGVKSSIRLKLLEQAGVADAQVVDTGQAAYRIMLRRDQMEQDSELRDLIDSDKVVRWIGEKRHIIAYPISSKTIYNMSSAQPDTNFSAEASATYTTRGSKAAMLGVFADFCPKVQRLLNLVPDGEVCEWKLRVHSPLPTWVCGSVALVGDACHPMLPHLAQGAAQAIEDAAVLGVVLSRVPLDTGEAVAEAINRSLRVYERIRKERAETLVDLAAASGRALHLGQGAAKAERDKQFAALQGGKQGGSVPDKWADADVQKMIYSHDCMKVAEDSFDELFNSI